MAARPHVMRSAPASTALPALFLPSHAQPAAPTAMMSFSPQVGQALTPDEQNQLVNVTGDGNCFFYCIAQLFNASHAWVKPKIPIDRSLSGKGARTLLVHYLRGCMAEHLLADKDSYFIPDLEQKTGMRIQKMRDEYDELSKEQMSAVLNKYADWIGRNGCFAGEIEYDVMANIFNVEIRRYRTEKGMTSIKQALREGTFRPEGAAADARLPVWKIALHARHYNYVKPSADDFALPAAPPAAAAPAPAPRSGPSSDDFKKFLASRREGGSRPRGAGINDVLNKLRTEREARDAAAKKAEEKKAAPKGKSSYDEWKGYERVVQKPTAPQPSAGNELEAARANYKASKDPVQSDQEMANKLRLDDIVPQIEQWILILKSGGITLPEFGDYLTSLVRGRQLTREEADRFFAEQLESQSPMSGPKPAGEGYAMMKNQDGALNAAGL